MKRSRSDFSDAADRNTPRITRLPDHVIKPIFERLPLRARVRIKALSFFWNSFAESILSSETNKRFLKSPWLMLPPNQSGEKGYASYSDSVSCRLMNLEENMVYSLTKIASNVALNIVCIGSSHGWLIFLDHSNLRPFLLNPFTEVRIYLPSLKPLLDISKIEELGRGLCKVLCGHHWRYIYTEYGKDALVSKAILTAEPAADLDFGVVLIYKFHWMTPNLAYYKNGNSTWVELHCTSPLLYIRDIICHENRLYAVSPSGSINIWDLEGSCPGERILIRARLPYICGPSFVCKSRGYLVESGGDILHVTRVVRYLSNDRSLGYRTDMFHIYKLNVERKSWVKVETLADRSIFVGGNHSVSISTNELRICKENSIYFTDDCQCQEFSGRDMGIYSLKDGNFMPIFEFPPSVDFMFHPEPRWLLPASCYEQKASK